MPAHDLSLPKIQLELLEDLSPPDQTGFLRLVRRRYRATYPDGSESVPFVYDAVDRSAIDAVVIAAHFVGSDGAHAGVPAQLLSPRRSPCAIAPIRRCPKRPVTAVVGATGRLGGYCRAVRPRAWRAPRSVSCSKNWASRSA